MIEKMNTEWVYPLFCKIFLYLVILVFTYYIYHRRKYITDKPQTRTESQIVQGNTESRVVLKQENSIVTDDQMTEIADEIVIESVVGSTSDQILRNLVMEPDTKTEITRNNSTMVELIHENETLRYELFHLQSKMQVIDHRITEMDAVIEHLENERAMLIQQIRTFAEEIIRRKKANETDEDTITHLRNQLQHRDMFHQREVKQLQERVHQLDTQLHRANVENIRFRNFLAIKYPDEPIELILATVM
jgi:chromosome segregation ATPase